MVEATHRFLLRTPSGFVLWVGVIAFALSFDGNNIGILISGDADYAPAVEYIQKKTDKPIIAGIFQGSWRDQLRTACWDHVFFEGLFPKLNLAPIQEPTASAS